MSRPIIAITMGDPAGVGPEICLRALSDPRVLKACVPVVVGNLEVLNAVSRRLDIPFAADTVHHDDVDGSFAPARPSVVDMHIISLADVTPGRVNAACGHVAYDYVAYAVERAMAGGFNAITTAPISKEALHKAGVDFAGHTEMLKALTRSKRAVMMLTGPRLTVALVTTHLPLKEVPRAIKLHHVAGAIRLTHQAMSQMLGRAPRIAVLALNCHGGEAGIFGDEERRTIIPAMTAVQSEGIDVAGPLSPDTAFTEQALRKYDVHVCMYHDQGLIPFKMLCFDEGVNVTLGLPIIRTSVAHGTAFDIAWKGKAEHSSMVAALTLAAKLVRKQRRS